MRDRANGNVVHARFSNGAHGLQTHAAARFSLRATGDEAHGRAKFFEGHIVQQDDVCPRSDGLFHLRQRVGFDFDFQRRKFFTGPLHSGGNGVRFRIAQSGQVIVFDQHHVPKAEAMILCAAATNGIFFQCAPAGGRLACVENRGARSGDSFHKVLGERCDAGKALDEIQGHTLGGEQCSRASFDPQQGGVAVCSCAIAHALLNTRRVRHLLKRGLGELQSAHNQFLSRDYGGSCHLPFRHGCKRCHIAAANIFSQSGADVL